MDSRQRVRTALEHKQADRVPLMLWMTPEICNSLQTHLGVGSEEGVLEALDIDLRWLLPDYIGPELKTGDNVRWDHFGIGYKMVKNQFGSYEEFVHHPLAEATSIDDIRSYKWPDPDWWDYQSLNNHIDRHYQNQPRWIGIGTASFFERAWNLTGFEKFFYDLAINPELVEAVMDGLMAFYLEQTSRQFEAAAARIDMVYIADDLASQDGLLISKDMYRRFIKPRWKKYNETIREKFGSHIKFHYHCCGAVGELIEDLIETGVDILNPMQPRAKGMDFERFKRSYPGLCFCGGFDIQQILPGGTPRQVADEARRLLKVLGVNGGYIAAAAHTIQPDTSVENILTMIDTFKQG